MYLLQSVNLLTIKLDLHPLLSMKDVDNERLHEASWVFTAVLLKSVLSMCSVCCDVLVGGALHEVSWANQLNVVIKLDWQLSAIE